jgi:hypothetical protein
MGAIDYNRRFPIVLTDSAGVTLDYDTKMTTMHTLTTAEAGGASLEFYLSHNGLLDTELVNIRVTVNAEVAITSYNLYFEALDGWKSLAPYSTALTGVQAHTGMSVSYPLSEDIVIGTKIKFVVVTAGACTVGVAANGRHY